MTIVEDLEEIATLAVGDRRHREVVDQQHVRARDRRRVVLRPFLVGALDPGLVPTREHDAALELIRDAAIGRLDREP